MDFGAAVPRVERLAPELLPELYIAHPLAAGASSGGAHGTLRQRFERGDATVHAALRRFAELADEGRECLRRAELDRLRELLDASFELRASIMELAPTDRDMAAIGRAQGAGVTLPGSGGAVVGLPRSAGDLAALAARYRSAGYGFFLPSVESSAPSA
jgi:hypothetical protein